jgi:CRP/FNR family cyclic AMP-dependent transcriptional regulator
MVATVNQRTSIEHLQRVAEFRGCTRRQLESVARLAERVHVNEGETLTKEGRIGREFFMILSGSVAVTRGGRRLTTLGPGQFFGELAAVSPAPRSATVTALCELDVLIIGPRELTQMFEIPGFRDSLLTTMANRLRSVDTELHSALTGDQGVPTTPPPVAE